MNKTIQLEALVGTRYVNLPEFKKVIEDVTGKKVYTIVDEGYTEASRDFGTDCEILVEFANYEQYTIFYLKDNNNNYYITEIQ